MLRILLVQKPSSLLWTGPPIGNYPVRVEGYTRVNSFLLSGVLRDILVEWSEALSKEKPGSFSTGLRKSRKVNVCPICTLPSSSKGLLKVAQPFVIAGFRQENERMLLALKRYVEKGT